MVRCFLFRCEIGVEVVRWLDDQGRSWMQQVFAVRLPSGVSECTVDDEDMIFHTSSILNLVKAGQAEEFT